jgi:D-sedoheptulose 7-phosphate isomerase
MNTAKEMGLHTIGMTGRGGDLAEHAEVVFTVPSDATARIQETHITVAHIWCDLVDRILYPESH